MEEEHGMPQYIRNSGGGGGGGVVGSRRRPSVRAMLYGTSAYQTYHSHSRPSPDFHSDNNNNNNNNNNNYEQEPYGSTFTTTTSNNIGRNNNYGHHYDARNVVPSLLEEEVILEEENNSREFLEELEEERERETHHHQYYQNHQKISSREREEKEVKEEKEQEKRGSARKFFIPRKFYHSKSLREKNNNNNNNTGRNNNIFPPSPSSSLSSSNINTSSTTANSSFYSSSSLTSNDNPPLLLISHNHNHHQHHQQRQHRDADRYTTPTSSSSYSSSSYTYASHSNNNSNHATTITTTPTPSRVATAGYRYENQEYRNSWRDRRNKSSSNNSNDKDKNNSTTTPTGVTNNNSARRRPAIDLPSPILPPKFEEDSPPGFEVSPVKLTHDRDSWFSEVSKDNEPEASGVSDFILSEDDDYRPSNFHASLNEQLARKISTCSAVSSTSTPTLEATVDAGFRSVSNTGSIRSVSNTGSVVGTGGHQRGRHQGKSNSSTPASTIRSKKGGLSGGLKDSIHSPFHTLSKNSSSSSLAAPTTAKNLSRTVSAPLHLNQPPLPPPLTKPISSATAEDEAKPTPPPSRAGHKRANSASFTSRSIRREPSITFTFNKEQEEKEKEKTPGNELNSEDPSQSKSLPSRSKDKKILPLPKRSKLPARFSSNGIATTEAPPSSLIYRQTAPTEQTTTTTLRENKKENSKSNSSNTTNSNAVTPKSSNEKVNVQGKSKNKEERKERTKAREKEKEREKDKNDQSLQNTPTVIIGHISTTNNSASPSPKPSPYNSVRTPFKRFVPPLSMNKNRDRDLRIPSDEKYGVHLLEDEDDDPTIRANHRISSIHSTQTDSANIKKERADASGPNDDVFLNLARSNTGGSNSTNDLSARRRSRYVSMSQHRNQLNHDHPRPSYQTSTPPSNRAAQNPYSPEDISPLSHSVQYQPTHFDDPDADHSLSHRSSFIRKSLREKDSPLQNNGHARSVSEAPRTPLTRYNGLASQRTIGNLVEHDRAAAAAATAAAAASNGYNRVVNDGTESTVSNTAPSVMWDELDELKSRIRRLEMTGGRTPTSPNGHQGTMSNSSSERPRTGTTAATTISSSPHHHTSGAQPTTAATPNGAGAGVAAGSTSPPAAAIPSSAASTLQNAIIKAKSVLPPEISNALEAASADAMGLVQLANSSGHPSTTALVTDRQVRRKVESMCRSLTELCISLSDGRMPLTQEEEEQVPLRIGYHAQNISPDRPGEYRSPSTLGYRIDRDGAATPSSNSKIFSRFESRRGSILSNASNSPAMNHHRMDGRVDASPSPAPTQSRLGQRNSMILRNRSSTIALDDEMAVGDETITPSYRSISRSQTESMRSGESPRASDFGGGLPTQAPTPRLANYNDRIHRAPSVAASDVSRGSNLSHRRHFSSATPSQQASTPTTAQARRFVDRNSLQQDIGQAISTNSSPGLSATTRAIAIDQIRRRDASDVQQHQHQPGDEIYSTSVPRDERRLRDGGSIGRVGSVSNRRTMLNNATYRDSGVSMPRDREPIAQRYR